MSFWPFFDFKDTRWTFGSKYITLRQDAKKGPTKVGLAHQMGWVGYVNNGTLFVKRFDYLTSPNGPIPYPDGGVNFETYTDKDMLEMETLGPLVTLAAGKMVDHTENWELHKDVASIEDEEAIEKNVGGKVKGK
jgi:hypothetical protein